MLRNTKNLQGFKIQATDGEIGTAGEFYFDDESWAIRYLTVQTGGWLSGRTVLISPISFVYVDWDAEQVNVSLTKEQVKNSPDINTHQPVSRQHESAYLGYYGYPNYWGGPYLWGPAYAPSALAIPVTGSVEATNTTAESPDSHLRNTRAVTGYDIRASDGEIGHVDGFIMDDTTWAIRYIEVATRDWWPGKKVLVSPSWIERVSWNEATVSVSLTRESIKTAPEYDESEPITEVYEDLLHFHYERSPHRPYETKPKSYFTFSGR